jgi:hypothetical protein
MKTTPGFECDVCGTPKRDTNHWWKGYLVPRQGSLHPAGLLIVAWDVVVESDAAMHLCGELCATKKLSEVMAKPLLIPADQPAFQPAVQPVPAHSGFGDTNITLP